MTRRLALLTLLAVLLPATPARADGPSRVTSYFCPPNCGLTALNGTEPIPGWTAGCAREHLGQYVTLVDAGITLYCEDTGAAWWFEADPNRVDAYGICLGEDYDYVIFSGGE